RFRLCSTSWTGRGSRSPSCARTPPRSKTFSFRSPGDSSVTTETEPRVETPHRAAPSTHKYNSLYELSSVRFKEFVREPEALFWPFVFPILLAVGLGIAFRNRPAEVVHVGIVGATPAADRLATAARANKGLAVEQLSADSARAALRTGRVALLAAPRDD